MNPSSSGWIDKFGNTVHEHQNKFKNFNSLYHTLKEIGFVYGFNINTPSFIHLEHTATEDEKAKINLLTALYFTYNFQFKEEPFERFLATVFQFYSILEIEHVSFFSKLITGNKTSAKLEKLLASRVYIEDNFISKTFNSHITNSLLCIDILLFYKHLNGEQNLKFQAQRLEYLAINITYHALGSKEKNKSDDKLSQLLGASLTFLDYTNQKFDGSYRTQLLSNTWEWENCYLLDMACLAVWEDHSLDYTESEFIFGIGKDLGFEDDYISKALGNVTTFFKDNVNTIPFLKNQNLALQFYDSMGKLVRKLILRNSKRLQKELSESAELVALLSKSTLRELNKEEKIKVQNQLLDIFKSIPSLAIFILPGGSILLPIFIKLIPSLLPSSFDENRVKKAKKDSN